MPDPANTSMSADGPDSLAAVPVAEKMAGSISEPTRPRVFYLDHLRVFLTALVILHHLAVTYGDIPLWYYTEPAKDPSGVILDRLLLANQAFFMGFFFLIAGYFVPGSYDRKGGRRFMRDRLVRFGMPILVFMILLRPILTAAIYPKFRAMAAEQGTDLPYWIFYLISWDPGPLWFLEVLLVFSWGYARIRRFRGEQTPASESEIIESGAWAPSMEAIIGLALALAGITYLWRFIVPVGQYWPIVGLPTPAFLPQYISLFTIGILAYRRGWLSSLPRSTGWFGLAMAAVATAVLYPVTLGVAFESSLWTGHGTRRSLLYALWESLFAVGIITGLLVLFREHVNGQGWLGRFLSRHSYTVYIIHPLVLVPLGYAFAWLSAIAVVKFAIVAVVAVPLCWLTAAVVCSIPQARRILQPR